MIVTTGKPTGYMRTEQQYENFIAELEWMHVPPKPEATGNSGFFVWADPIPAMASGGFTRGIEVQVLVNLEKKDAYTSHGDIFASGVRSANLIGRIRKGGNVACRVKCVQRGQSVESLSDSCQRWRHQAVG